MGNMIQTFEELMGMSLTAYLISEIPNMLISVAVYVFTALALYSIAKRRGIHNPWLAWIPVASLWLMGCISDQYQSVAKGKVTRRRTVLLVTDIMVSVLGAIVLVLCFVTLGRMFDFMFDAFGLSLADFMDPSKIEMIENMEFEISDADSQKLLSGIMGPAVGMVLLALVMLPVGIIYMVFCYIALHDIYKSCDPSNSTLFLVLSILIGYAQPVFLFVCRNKDFGMPMRQAPQPVYQPYQPIYEEPVFQQPTEPPVEPWEQKEE